MSPLLLRRSRVVIEEPAEALATANPMAALNTRRTVDEFVAWKTSRAGSRPLLQQRSASSATTGRGARNR